MEAPGKRRNSFLENIGYEPHDSDEGSRSLCRFNRNFPLISQITLNFCTKV